MLLDSLSNSVHHDALTLQSALMLDRVARSCVERRTTSNRARSCQRQSRLGSISAAVAVAVAEKCHTRHKDICVTTSTVLCSLGRSSKSPIFCEALFRCGSALEEGAAFGGVRAQHMSSTVSYWSPVLSLSLSLSSSSLWALCASRGAEHFPGRPCSASDGRH